MKKITFELVDDQKQIPLDAALVEKIVTTILADAGYTSGAMEIAVVDNDTIHRLNVEFLGHNYPTDVLAFEMDRDAKAGLLEGNVIVSAEMAAERSAEFDQSDTKELLLYIIHGTLHLVGCDDDNDDDINEMREKEQRYLAMAD